MKRLMIAIFMVMAIISSVSASAEENGKYQSKKGEALVKKGSSQIKIPNVSYGYGCGSEFCTGGIYIPYDEAISKVVIIVNNTETVSVVPQKNSLLDNLDNVVPMAPWSISTDHKFEKPGTYVMGAMIYYGKKTVLVYEAKIQFLAFNCWIVGTEADGAFYKVTYQLYPQFGLNMADYEKASVLVNGQVFENLEIYSVVQPWETQYFFEAKISASDYKKLTMWTNYIETTILLNGGPKATMNLYY